MSLKQILSNLGLPNVPTTTAEVEDIVARLPWNDILTATAIAQLKKALTTMDAGQRKETFDTLLTGYCKSCFRPSNECGCRKRGMTKR